MASERDPRDGGGVSGDAPDPRNVSEPAAYSGAAPERARVPTDAGATAGEAGDATASIREGEAGDGATASNGDGATGGEATASNGDGEAGNVALARFREILLETDRLDWAEKTLAGLSQKMLWRDEQTGASIALVRFAAGAGIPSRHAHASNQFMFCLSGRYVYTATGLTLTPGSFYWNPKGCLHGPTLAEEDSVMLEFYDGPHYATQPDWYASEEDAR